MDSNEKLKLPSGMNYECLKCGRGCEDFEEIVIDPATLEGLRKLDLREVIQDLSPEMAFLPPDVPSPFHPGMQMLRKIKKGPEREACCFLQENKLCALHCKHGVESKPVPCRSFPYGFTETPGGDYVGLSFACTAVLQNHGSPVTEQAPDVESTRAISPSRKVNDQFTLSSGIPLTWEQYLLVESDLLEILDDSGSMIGDRLIAQSVYLQLLSKFLLEARGSVGAEWDSNPELNREPIETFRKRMRGAEEERPWGFLFRIAERPSSHNMLRRVFLGYVLAFKRKNIRYGRFGMALNVLGAYMQFALGRGSVQPPRAEHPLAYRDLTKIRFNPRRWEHEELLRRFFHHCIFRKDLIITESIKFAHNMMLMHYGLIHWYAAAFAAEAGHAEIEIEDLREAVRSVEQHYVYHSRFTQFFMEYPKLKQLMDTMFQRPIYAFAMGRHEEGMRDEG